jgi:hypothetical protein
MTLPLDQEVSDVLGDPVFDIIIMVSSFGSLPGIAHLPRCSIPLVLCQVGQGFERLPASDAGSNMALSAIALLYGETKSRRGNVGLEEDTYHSWVVAR